MARKRSPYADSMQLEFDSPWQEVMHEFDRDNICKNLSLATIQNYRYYIKDFVRYLWHNDISEYSQITGEFVSIYILNMRYRKLSVFTINSYLKYVRRFLNFIAEKRQYQQIKVRTLREPESFKDTLNKKDMLRIFSRANCFKPISIACCLLLGTGIRSRTLRHIKVGDIDFSTGLMTCTHTKNSKILVLPLTDYLQELLKVYIDYQKLKDDDYLIINNKRTMFTRTGIYTAICKYLDSLAISKTGVHIFRHTFAKNLVLNKCDAFTLMRWLGHSKMDEAKTYVRLYSDDLKASLVATNPASQENIRKLKKDLTIFS